MFKKRLIGMLVFAVVLMCSTTVSANGEVSLMGAGEWDDMGTYTVKANSKSTTIYSGGGDFRVCMSSTSTKAEVKLFEYDPNGIDVSLDGGFLVPGKLLYPGECLVWDVRSVVDGDNKKAELYLRNYSDHSIKVTFWD